MEQQAGLVTRRERPERLRAASLLSRATRSHIPALGATSLLSRAAPSHLPALGATSLLSRAAPSPVPVVPERLRARSPLPTLPAPLPAPQPSHAAGSSCTCPPSVSRYSASGQKQRERDKTAGPAGEWRHCSDRAGGGPLRVPQLPWAQLFSGTRPCCSVSGCQGALFCLRGSVPSPLLLAWLPVPPGKLLFTLLPCRAVVRSKCSFWTLQQEEHRERLTGHSEGHGKGVPCPQHTTGTSQNKPRSVLETWA